MMHRYTKLHLLICKTILLQSVNFYQLLSCSDPRSCSEFDRDYDIERDYNLNHDSCNSGNRNSTEPLIAFSCILSIQLEKLGKPETAVNISLLVLHLNSLFWHYLSSHISCSKQWWKQWWKQWKLSNQLIRISKRHNNIKCQLSFRKNFWYFVNNYSTVPMQLFI